MPESISEEYVLDKLENYLSQRQYMGTIEFTSRHVFPKQRGKEITTHQKNCKKKLTTCLAKKLRNDEQPLDDYYIYLKSKSSNSRLFAAIPIKNRPEKTIKKENPEIPDIRIKGKHTESVETTDNSEQTEYEKLQSISN